MNNAIYKLIIILLFFGLSSMMCQDNKESKTVVSDYPAGLKIIKRADWGWTVSEMQPKLQDIKYITIHHGGEEYYDTVNTDQKVRNLQTWSRREKKWNDIPYHFMIDLRGNIYEARPIEYAGDTNTEYNPFEHALVEVMGNYEIQELNKPQYEALTGLIAFLAVKYNIPVEKIKSHKDYSAITVCPGANIYKLLTDGSLLSSVKEKINTKSSIKTNKE